MSHCDLIYLYMLDKGPITSIVAFQEFGCTRLSARIKELKKKGVKIKDRWVTRTNWRGETKRYKEYWREET